MSDKRLKEFKKATDEMVEALTSEEMLKRMRKFKDLPPTDRLYEASKLLSVEGLAAQGVKLPKGMRLSSRYFETEIGGFELNSDEKKWTAAAREKLEGHDSEFVATLRRKHPEILERIKTLPPEVFDGMQIPGGQNFSACGGAGGTIAGTGGCACGGASTLF